MRTTPPFRADHVGSLLRPPRLLARPGRLRGRAASTPPSCGPSRTTRSPTSSRMQEETGLQSATDGEFRRASWHMDFIYQLGGISKAPGNLAVKFHNPAGTIEFTPAALHVGSKLRLDQTIFADDFRYLQSVVTDGDAEADHPVAEHGPLPRRPGRDRPGRLPGHRGVLGGPVAPPTPSEVARLGRAGLHATCSSTTPAWPT